MAEEKEVLIVDLDGEMTENERYFEDHIHCNPKGRMEKAEMLRDLPVEEIARSREAVP